MGVCENWKPPRLKMATNHFRKTNFMQPTRKLSTCTQEGSIFFLSGERVFAFWDFWGFWCSHHVSIYCSHKVPNGSQWCSQFVPQVSFTCVPQSIPNSTTIYPIFFPQIFTLLNYIAKPKEKGYIWRGFYFGSFYSVRIFWVLGKSDKPTAMPSVSLTGELLPIFDLKNMISTHTKDFSWK